MPKAAPLRLIPVSLTPTQPAALVVVAAAILTAQQTPLQKAATAVATVMGMATVMVVVTATLTALLTLPQKAAPAMAMVMVTVMALPEVSTALIL